MSADNKRGGQGKEGKEQPEPPKITVGRDVLPWLPKGVESQEFTLQERRISGEPIYVVDEDAIVGPVRDIYHSSVGKVPSNKARVQKMFEQAVAYDMNALQSAHAPRNNDLKPLTDPRSGARSLYYSNDNGTRVYFIMLNHPEDNRKVYMKVAAVWAKGQEQDLMTHISTNQRKVK